jgi:hypothetical protein
MEKFILENLWIIWIAIIWTVPWKGVALWKAARNSDKFWFIALFIFNTLAILEILYIFIFSKRKGGAGTDMKYPPMQVSEKENSLKLIKGL